MLLTANDSYIISVKQLTINLDSSIDQSYAEASFTINVTELNRAVSRIREDIGFEDSIAGKEEKYYRFTASETGRYTYGLANITPNYAEGRDLSWEIYLAGGQYLDKCIEDTGRLVCGVQVTSGKDYVVKLINSGESEASNFSIKVEDPFKNMGSIEAPELISIGESYFVIGEIGPGGNSYYSFIAPVTAAHQFSITAIGGIDSRGLGASLSAEINLLLENRSVSPVAENTELNEFMLEQDNQYRIYISQDYFEDDYQGGQFQISIRNMYGEGSEQAPVLLSKDITHIGYMGTGPLMVEDIANYKFTADTTGTYSFSVTNYLLPNEISIYPYDGYFNDDFTGLATCSVNYDFDIYGKGVLSAISNNCSAELVGGGDYLVQVKNLELTQAGSLFSLTVSSN